MSAPIAVPDRFAERVDGYLRQQRELQLALQIAVDTASDLLDVPQGWRYDPTARVFVPADVQPPPDPIPTAEVQ